MAHAPNGALVEVGEVSIDLDATGEGEAEISISQPFLQAPAMMLQQIGADGGAWLVAAESNTLARVTVTGSDLRSTTTKLAWVALEIR